MRSTRLYDYIILCDNRHVLVTAIQVLEENKYASNCVKCDFSSCIAMVYCAADEVCMVYGMLLLA
jgi:hypothetical protein